MPANTNTTNNKMDIYGKLGAIQQELNVPKNQYNSFGKYSYRSCEDILEAVKPLLRQYGCSLVLTDEMVEIGGRNYIKANVRLMNLANDRGVGEYIECNAYAREDEKRAGMSSEQQTGSASSYARKYALNGLFLIDDVKDADATNTHGQAAPAPAAPKAAAPAKKAENKPVTELDEETYWQYVAGAASGAIYAIKGKEYDCRELFRIKANADAAYMAKFDNDVKLVKAGNNGGA